MRTGDPEGKNKNKRMGTNAKEWGMRKFAFLPVSRTIDVGKVDGDLSSPAAPSLSLFHRSLFSFFIWSGLDYFLISPNVSSTSRHIGWLPRQFRREKDHITDNKCNLNPSSVFNAIQYLNGGLAKDVWCTSWTESTMYSNIRVSLLKAVLLLLSVIKL